MGQQWQKSSFSGAGGENCVEIAARGEAVFIRESDDPNVITVADRRKFAALIAGVKAGDFDRQT
ncbi:DUF397 domain-containing protein [Streptomyces monomycini]|uniref:DUF397 domain-containing protein n=1 Tax=Streptomyces monomycini TaxID=371720 RepID=UPI0004AA8234|nr:DUF397 domain-containing protein [Streptomyces monomycini]